MKNEAVLVALIRLVDVIRELPRNDPRAETVRDQVGPLIHALEAAKVIEPSQWNWSPRR